MLIDAHMHLNSMDVANVLKDHQIKSLVNSDNPNEYQFLKTLQSQDVNMYISAGIHPWHVDKVSWDDMKDILEEVCVIGEIGLDSVWCQTDVELQKEIFERQLKFASQSHKPVVLHIKGLEKEALDYLKQYKNTYLVHWYSCDQYLDEYIKLGCYFTIGPSLLKDETVYQVAKKVSLDRILIETDGLNALAWAEDRHVEISEYVSILQRSMNEIANIKNVSLNYLEAQMEENFKRWKQSKS